MPGQRRTYSKRQKLTAVIAADMTSTVAAAEATGVPRTTLQYWMEDPELGILRQNARQMLAEEMTVIARLAAQKLAEAIRAGRVEPRDLIIAAGMATDKSQLLSGQATARTETRDLTETLDDHERAALRDILDGVLREAEATAPVPAGVDEA